MGEGTLRMLDWDRADCLDTFFGNDVCCRSFRNVLDSTHGVVSSISLELIVAAEAMS